MVQKVNFLKIIILTSSILLLNVCNAQNKSLKEQAKEEFKNESYLKAISLLEQALKESPDDPEVYYLLGFYNHYNAYDSRPLVGYNRNYSNKVFKYFEKALELKPDYGDAKYFYGAECSANAFIYMQKYEADSLKMIYKKAFNKGVYPDWLLEFGRNFLNSCDREAILFAGGNPDFDVCMYLQLHEKYRTDITILPIGYIDRPWYVGFLKKGLPGVVRNIKIDLTDDQIMDVHPFKWDTTTVKIPISGEVKAQLNLPENAMMEWTVNPDYTSNRLKQENQAKKRTFLSPQRAILLHIVEANNWQRPIYFSSGAVEFLLGGLNEYSQDCGLVTKLLPVKTKGTHWETDKEKLESLIMNPKNFKCLKNIVNSDIPRISRLTTIYSNAALTLANIYSQENNMEAIKELSKFYEKYLKAGLYKDVEDSDLQEINRLIK